MRAIFTAVILSFSSLLYAAEVTDISADELMANKQDDWLILDVRSAEEYAAGHVPGAMNIAHSDIADHLDQLQGHQQRPVVVYCKSGYRASLAAKTLAKHGFSQILHLDGDMQGWLNDERPVEK